MRSFLLATLLLFASIAVSAQDLAQQMNQQAQFNQQMMQNSQQAMQRLNQQASQAAIDSLQVCDQCVRAATPKASVPPGAYTTPITVRLTSGTRRSHIFYTTDGWTPTPQSTPYSGPITLTRTQTLRAIAIAPGSARSAIADLAYTFPPAMSAPSVMSAPQPSDIAAPTAKLLPSGTPLRLRFTAPLDSATAYVGQPIQLALAQDLVVDGRVLASAGTPARGTVTEVDNARHNSLPGILSFAVQSIQIENTAVPLTGARTQEGPELSNKHRAFEFIPALAIADGIHRGPAAHIAPGAEFIAHVAANTPL